MTPLHESIRRALIRIAKKDVLSRAANSTMTAASSSCLLVDRARRRVDGTGDLPISYTVQPYDIPRSQSVFPQLLAPIPPAHFCRPESVHALEVSVEVTDHGVAAIKGDRLNWYDQRPLAFFSPLPSALRAYVDATFSLLRC